MTFPSLEETIETIRTIADTDELDADTRIEELDVDSIDLLEWLYEIETEQGIALDESLFEGLTPTVTLREVHELIRGYFASKAAEQSKQGVA